MNSPALVTVIVPGRDVAGLIEPALASLQAQSENRWQAILVDDGSTDGTGMIMAAAAASDPRIRVISHPSPRGLGAARNAALDLVDTQFTAFLDGDDVMRPDALRVALETLEASGSELLVGAYTRLRFVDSSWIVGEVQPWVAASTAPRRIRTSVDAHPDVVGNIVAWSKVTRTALWQRTGVRFPEGVLYEDQLVAQQLYVAADGIDTIPDVLVDWRIRATGDSITQREADPTVLADCITQMTAGLDVLRQSNPGAAARRTTQILRMDLPRLAGIAADASAARTLLGTFARTLEPTAEDRELRTQSVTAWDAPDSPLVGTVLDAVTAW